MKEIIKYLEEKGIDSQYLYSTDGPDRIRFNVFNHEFYYELYKDSTIEDFKEFVNSSYLNHLKQMSEFHKLMHDSLSKEVKNFKPPFI